VSAEVGPNRAERRALWPKRRQWLDRIAGENRLTTGAKSWLMLLAKRSDDGGKPVWGNQVRMALHIGRSDRSVRRYRAEAEQLGYITVYRSKPERGPSGRWSRRKANSYYLRLPAKNTDQAEAPRRRQRASYCVVHPHKAASADSASARHDRRPFGAAADLPDSDGRSSPSRGASTDAAPPVSDIQLGPWAPTETERAAAAAHIAAMKASLRHATTKAGS
jgi:hypothetical protein